MNSLNIKKWLLAAILVVAVGGKAHAIVCGSNSTPVERFTVAGSEIYCLDQAGNITSSGTFTLTGRILTSSSTVSTGYKIGNRQANPTVTPTTSTGKYYGLQVPFINAGSGTMAAGALVIGVSTGTGLNVPGFTLGILSTTTWIGVNTESLAAGATGYMTVAGYGLALTTGTVAIGDELVSTTTTAGYMGAIAPGTSVLEGSVVGKAMSQGTATGGLTLIRLGN